MYLDVSTVHHHGRTYQRVLLRESYRDHGQVKEGTPHCQDQIFKKLR